MLPTTPVYTLHIETIIAQRARTFLCQRLWQGLRLTGHYSWAKMVEVAGPGQNVQNRRAGEW